MMDSDLRILDFCSIAPLKHISAFGGRRKTGPKDGFLSS